MMDGNVSRDLKDDICRRRVCRSIHLAVAEEAAAVDVGHIDLLRDRAAAGDMYYPCPETCRCSG
jgi:hypothetical protein